MIRRISLAGITGSERWKAYVRGLQPKLRAYVLDKNPTSLDDAETFGKKGEQLHNIEGLCVHKGINALAKHPDNSNTTEIAGILREFTQQIATVVKDSMRQESPRHDQYIQHTTSNRTTNSRPVCEICNKVGHYTGACWHNNSHRPPHKCTICHKIGHSSDRCWQRSNNGHENRSNHTPRQSSRQYYDDHTGQSPHRNQFTSRQRSPSPGRQQFHTSQQSSGQHYQDRTGQSPHRNQFTYQQRSSSPGRQQFQGNL